MYYAIMYLFILIKSWLTHYLKRNVSFMTEELLLINIALILDPWL